MKNLKTRTRKQRKVTTNRVVFYDGEYLCMIKTHLSHYNAKQRLKGLYALALDAYTLIREIRNDPDFELIAEEQDFIFLGYPTDETV